MLSPDDKEHIRAIFLHHVEPVTPELAAELLGWDLHTMDAAIKWRAVELDENSLDEPRINRAELLELATDQWSMSEIVEALGRDVRRVFSRKTGWSSAGALMRDALEKIPPASVPEVVLRRVAARRRRAPMPAPLPHSRRNRLDGVREATLSEVGSVLAAQRTLAREARSQAGHARIRHPVHGQNRDQRR